MATFVNFKNEKTGQQKSVKVGWSWTLFLFSNWFGIPQFMRGLYWYGALIAVFQLITFAAPPLIIFAIGIAIWMGACGNKITALHLLNNGWVWIDKDGEDVAFAKKVWNLS